MPTVDEVLTKATDGLGDDLKPLDEKDTKVETTDKKPDPKEDKKDDPKPEDKKPDVKDGDSDDKNKPDEKEDEDFTAAEVERKAEDAPTTEVETAPVNTDNLNDEGKYIVDNLPFMVARIKDGDNIKELQVKSWTQLPEDVTFASKRDELSFMNALTAQENRAQSLQNQFRQNQQTEQAKNFEKLEDDSIWVDVAELQQEGIIPNFTGPKDNPTFKTDADAERMEAVVNYMKERNGQYLAEYNQGRPYRHIGFKEAYFMYDRQHPAEKPEQKKEDENREEVADHMNVNRGLAAKEFKRPLIKSGTRIGDILDRFDAQEGF
jgi:hypothetical protein